MNDILHTMQDHPRYYVLALQDVVFDVDTPDTERIQAARELATMLNYYEYVAELHERLQYEIQTHEEWRALVASYYARGWYPLRGAVALDVTDALLCAMLALQDAARDRIN